jgi:Holliday junction DNA helicase RuvB
VEDRIITGELKTEDFDIEGSLRPRSLDEYIGQTKVKENLNIFIKLFGAQADLINILTDGFLLN